MDFEDTAKRILEHWGFRVSKIQESEDHGVKSPDFRVEDGKHQYIIEVKSRGDAGEEAEARHAAYGNGDLFEKHMPLARRNTISGIVLEAAKQLEAYGDSSAFRLLWFAAIDDAQTAKFEQFQNSLYGTTRVFDLDGDSHHRPCYFFRDSDFFRCKGNMDAAIVSTETEARLCLNPFSPKVSELQKSQMVSHFGTAIVDPAAEEVVGDAYIADCDLPRSNGEEVMNYLRKKYNKTKLQNIDLGYHQVSTTVPRDV
jgi:hypothetical protein